jgi:hypothetical protein
MAALKDPDYMPIPEFSPALKSSQAPSHQHPPRSHSAHDAMGAGRLRSHDRDRCWRARGNWWKSAGEKYYPLTATAQPTIISDRQDKVVDYVSL